MKFLYFKETNFPDLEDKSKEELIKMVKDAYITHINYWMKNCERLLDQLDREKEIRKELRKKLSKDNSVGE